VISFDHMKTCNRTQHKDELAKSIADADGITEGIIWRALISAVELDEHGVGYVRYDNSLLAVDDLDAAAELCERFAHKAWPRVLNAFARRLNSILPALRAANYGGYHWVLDQAEFATDVMFTTRPRRLEL
jgi:hypothetical protein